MENQDDGAVLEGNTRSEAEEDFIRHTELVLSSLPKREELTLRLRFGLGGNVEHSYREIALALGHSQSTVRRIEKDALRRLRRPIVQEPVKSATPSIRGLAFVVEKVKELTPELIAHLKANHDDIGRIHWEVFQHLVGEFLKSHGFEDVRIVGRNPNTSADLYAARTLSRTGLTYRLFVEAKRVSDQVGISVINEVAGAMLTERPRIGWHAAMIVSTAGFSRTHKFDQSDLTLMGIDLKDKDDLIRWLVDYEPNERGLWLPKPSTELPNIG